VLLEAISFVLRFPEGASIGVAVQSLEVDADRKRTAGSIRYSSELFAALEDTHFAIPVW
jgi:hypothetical protein